MKKILFLLSFIALALSIDAQVAANTNWTYIGRTKELPSAVVIPSVSRVDGSELHYVDIDLDATTYDNNNQATAFAAIGAAIKTAISPTYIEVTMDQDTSTIESVRLGIMSIQRVWDNIGLRDKVNILKQAEDIFKVRVRVEIDRDDE